MAAPRRLDIKGAGQLAMKIVLLSSVMLIRLPTLLNRTEDPVIWIVCLAPFWVVILHRLVLEPLRAKSPVHLTFAIREGIPALAFIGLTLASFLRAAHSGAIGLLEALGHVLLWTTIALFAVAVFLRRADGAQSQSSELRGLLVHALGVYILANVVLHFAGRGSPKQIYTEDIYRPATILAVAGIDAERVLFPTAAGIASFGTVAGASLVGALLALEHSARSRHRTWLALIAAASAYAVLASDSRSAALYTLVSVGGLLLIPRALRAIAGILPLLVGLVPMLLVGIAPWISGLELIRMISRSGADIATLNSRIYIWDAGLAEAGKLDSGALFGYGSEGPYSARLSELYRGHFQSYVEPTRIGLHNALLQYALDIGILGAIIFFFCFCLLMRSMKCGGVRVRGERSLFGLALYLLLAGATDSVPTPYSQELFAVFVLLLIGASAVSHASVQLKPEAKTAEKTPNRVNMAGQKLMR